MHQELVSIVTTTIDRVQTESSPLQRMWAEGEYELPEPNDEKKEDWSIDLKLQLLLDEFMENVLNLFTIYKICLRIIYILPASSFSLAPNRCLQIREG